MREDGVFRTHRTDCPFLRACSSAGTSSPTDRLAYNPSR
jgi:hypothetical protein